MDTSHREGSWRLISSHRDHVNVGIPSHPSFQQGVTFPSRHRYPPWVSNCELFSRIPTYLHARARTPRLLSAPLLFLLFTLLELFPRQANSNSPPRILFRVLSSCCACTFLPTVISLKCTCFRVLGRGVINKIIAKMWRKFLFIHLSSGSCIFLVL